MKFGYHPWDLTALQYDLDSVRATMLAIFISIFPSKLELCHHLLRIAWVTTFESVGIVRTRKWQLSAALIRWWFLMTQYQRLPKIKIRYAELYVCESGSKINNFTSCSSTTSFSRSLVPAAKVNVLTQKPKYVSYLNRIYSILWMSECKVYSK